MKNYWLMKSEPDVYSIDDLERDGKTLWEGVRNYQARNFMAEGMKVGDLVLFYHSNAEPPGVAGIGKIVAEAVADPTQFNKKSEYYDAKSKPEKPRWSCVTVGFKARLSRFVPLDELRTVKELKNMKLLMRGQRLSVQPVTSAEFSKICSLGGLKARDLE